MRYYFTADHGQHKLGDVVFWCGSVQKVRNLVDAGVLSTTPPEKPKATPKTTPKEATPKEE